MISQETTKRNLAEYLLAHSRMIIDPTPEMMQTFPMQTPEGDETAWLKAVAKLLGDAVELRRPPLPSGKVKLAVKDRAVLFNYTQSRTLEDMASDRKVTDNA